MVLLDEKVNTFIPNPKIKKIMYIGVGSLFGFIFLIIILGSLLSPFMKAPQGTGTIINKTKIISSSPEPQKELSENQKQLLKLQTEVKDMQFPDSLLNIPVIEKDLSI